MAREMMTVDLAPTPKFIPPWTDGGDREFAGHGPRVNVFTWLDVQDRNELWAHVWMRARETESDWTEAEGTADYLVFRDSNVSDIYRIMSDTISAASYTDDNHADDVLQQSEAELVNNFVCVGDTGGDEAGIRTSVTVHFNPVTLDVERSSTPPGDRTIRVSPTPKFIPQHVAGDRDFGGHGPRVNVSASIAIRNTREIWATISMNARETQSDWTEVQGSTNFRLYGHDRPILAILSDTFSQQSYIDTDHSDDELPLSPNDLVNKFVCVGDTGGDEAGTRTGVTVHFNPITFRVGA